MRMADALAERWERRGRNKTPRRIVGCMDTKSKAETIGTQARAWESNHWEGRNRRTGCSCTSATKKKIRTA